MADCTWDIFRPMNMPSGRASCGTCCTARSAYVSTSSSSFKSSCRSHRAAMRNKTFLAIPTGAPRKPLLQESPSTGLQYLAGKESSSRSAYLSSRNSYMLTTWVVQSSAGQGSPTPSRRCSQKDANDSSGGGAMRRMAAATTSRPESRFGKPCACTNSLAKPPGTRACATHLHNSSRKRKSRRKASPANGNASTEGVSKALPSTNNSATLCSNKWKSKAMESPGTNKELASKICREDPAISQAQSAPTLPNSASS
mmetsp:Transcript_118396/g.379571  ORF Transcript_118396/g.379571 Transcript_118396/m.379571 type:complete len:255 (+) Transcript_118396:418-1182(+)